MKKLTPNQAVKWLNQCLSIETISPSLLVCHLPCNSVLEISAPILGSRDGDSTILFELFAEGEYGETAS